MSSKEVGRHRIADPVPLAVHAGSPAEIPRSLRNCRDSSAPERATFGSHQKSPGSLIYDRVKSRKALTNSFKGIHAASIAQNILTW